MNRRTLGIVEFFEAKVTIAGIVPTTITVLPETLKDLATVLRAYVTITEGMEVTENHLRERAMRAEVEAAKAQALADAIDRLSLTGLIFLWMERDRKCP